MINTLNIPLAENPTRQKIWRVVVFAAPIALAVFVAAVIIRGAVILDTLSSFAPADTKMTIRIMKTPETSSVLEEKFHGALLFPNAPFTTDELSLWSKRGSAIFLNETGVVGIAVAGKVPESALANAKALGFSTAERSGATYIGIEAPQSEKLSLRLPIVTFLPWFNGEAFVPAEHKGAPLRLTKNALTISGIGRAAPEINAFTDDKLVKVAISAEEAQNLLGFDVPLVFPGLRALEEQMTARGFLIALGDDEDGTPYTISVPEGDLSKEDMESVVSELYYTKNLSEDSQKEIISTSSAKPVTVSDTGATITSITDNTGITIRAAQTAHSLLLTNRPIDIRAGVTAAEKNTCLPTANQWIAPTAMAKLLPANLSTPGWTIAQNLLESKEIAFSLHQTRICW